MLISAADSHHIWRGRPCANNYHPLDMRFDKARCAPTVTLSADERSASNGKTVWGPVVGDEYLASGVYEVEIGCDSVDNLSLFFGVCAPGYWEEVAKAAADEEEGDILPRDSPHCICMHGDGRCFIKGKEKDWGLMRVATGEKVKLTLDFNRGQVTFELNRVVRGKAKCTIAEIPGLFASATVVACFGGRDQQLTIAKCAERKAGASDDGAESSAPRRKVRDVFNDALSGERVAPVAFSAPSKTSSYAEQIRDMAATMETSM